MTRELIQKEVDGRLYEFQQFTTTVALKTLSQIVQLVGEPLAALGLGDAGKQILQREVDLEKAAKALVAELAGAGTDDAIKVIKSLVSGDHVLCDHNKVLFDDHFRGPDGLSHLFRVVWAALEAQFGNFLGAVSARLPVAPAAKAMGGPIRAR